MTLDLNMCVLAGKLAATPELNEFDSGTTTMRLLVTVRSDKRIDVIPVMWFNPDLDIDLEVGDDVWIAGAVQRRFWSGGVREGSRVDIIAHEISVRNKVNTDG